jgi:predicted DNA-binding transcriptional regulator AlpA
MRKADAKKRVAEEGGLDGVTWLLTYQVYAYCDMGEGTLKRHKEQNDFPKPRKFGKRKNLYSKAEIDKWMSEYIFLPGDTIQHCYNIGEYKNG